MISKFCVTCNFWVLVYKILSVIPAPGADTTQLASIFKDGGNSGLSFFSALVNDK